MEEIIKKDGRVWTSKTDINRFLFPDEFGRFEDKLKPKQKFSVRFLINTGARITEAQNVKVEDVDLQRKRIILRVTKIKARKGEKKSRPRIIPISTQFNRYLKGEIKKRKLKPEDYLQILSNSALNTAYKLAGKRAGIKNPQDISSHTFRKTLEVWLMALGVDSLRLTAHLGHDIRTASQHYVSPDIFDWDDKKKMRIVIGDLYGR